jgi:hypothetical protein
MELIHRGEGFFHVSGAGHESSAALAAHLGAQDWLHLHSRDKALMVARGMAPRAFFDALVCNAESGSAGRQMCAHPSSAPLHLLSLAGPVGNSALQAVGVAQPVNMDVPTLGVLTIVRTALRWLVPLAAIATLALIVMGLAAHPERSTLFRSLGLGLLFLALMTIVLGYLVPKFLVPVLSDDPWANAPARLADDMLPVLIGLELLLVGGALALLAGTGMMRRRQRWSTPVSTYRYQEERRWSA